MSASNNTRTTEIISMSDIGSVSSVETVETTTTINTKTTTTIHVSSSPDRDVVKTIEPKVVTYNVNKEDSNSRETSPDDMKSTSDGSNNDTDDNSTDKQAKPELMNIQSVCPTAKPAATYVVLNRQGKQMKISLAPRNTETEEKSEENKGETDSAAQCKYIMHIFNSSNLQYTFSIMVF